jgi:hypothetical protein
MERYTPIRIITTPENPKPRYRVTKYPQIPLASSDIYVYTTQGDRYDTLAQIYYSDSSLWWIINRANPSQDCGSLFPSIGSQIRIPSPTNINSILTQYEGLN